MHCLALTYMMLLLNSVLASLPAPRNPYVVSVNFHYLLRWDPGPGTPPGTEYIVTKRVHGKKRTVRVSVTTTSIQLKLDTTKRYRLSVQASFNQSLSPESDLTFCPYEDTKIGPPVLSLAGCGDCIEINISLPEADRSSGIDDIQKFYFAEFRIVCKRGKDIVVDYLTKKMNIIIPNLNTGVEYCVQVTTKTILNKNTEPSAWKCIYTSIIEPHREPVVLGVGAALLILLLVVLTVSIFCLHYTGFLCTLKAPPRAIIILSHGYTLTPGGTTPDPISICSEMVKQRSQHNPTIPLTAPEDEEEEEEEEEGEEEIVDYMERGAQRSLGQSLCGSSSNVTEKSEPAASGDSGSLREKHAEFDGGVTHGGQEEDGVMAFTQTEVQVGEEEQEDKTRQNDDVFDSSSNVNLFSVTIAALSAGEEEEQNERRLLSNLVKQTETEASVQSSDEDNDTDFETSDTQHEQVDEAEEDHEDDEDDEDTDFSGYMAHT